MELNLFSSDTWNNFELNSLVYEFSDLQNNYTNIVSTTKVTNNLLAVDNFFSITSIGYDKVRAINNTLWRLKSF